MLASPRANVRPSSQPTVHRLLKKHSDECGTGDARQAGHDAVIGCCVPSAICVSGIVRAVHQSSSKLGDTPLVRLDLFESLPSRGFAVEPLQQTLQQNRALHRSTTHAVRPAPDVELYSSTALQSALHLYSSTALYTLHPLHPPSEDDGAEERTTRVGPRGGGMKVAARIGEKLRKEIGSGRRPRVGDG